MIKTMSKIQTRKKFYLWLMDRYRTAINNNTTLSRNQKLMKQYDRDFFDNQEIRKNPRRKQKLYTRLCRNLVKSIFELYR